MSHRAPTGRRERPGYRAIPYAIEESLRGLPPAQRAVLVSLLFEACWEPTEVVVDGQTVQLDRGEALVSSRGLDRTLSLGGGAKGGHLARRALASGVRVGLISTRPAVPKGGAPRGAGDGAPRGAPRGAPPTVVRVLRHRAILWPVAEDGAPRGAPPGAGGGAGGGAIPSVQQLTSAADSLSPSPAPQARGRGNGVSKKVKRGEKETDPRHAPLVSQLTATFEELRGTAYGFGGRDARAVAELLRLAANDVGEVDRRWRRALTLHGKWPGCSSLPALASRWNDLAGTARAPDYTDPAAYLPVSLRGDA